MMGVTLSAGDSLAWWSDVTERSFDELAGAAADILPGAEGLLFLPHLTGERTPHLDPYARGAFVGLTARHGAAHMTRAVMEGVVFSMRDALEVMRGLGVSVEQIRATGGGARSPLWRRLQADVYDEPIHRATADEGPAYGAALLGGVAANLYEDVREACSVVSLRDEVTEPTAEHAKIYDEHYEIYRSLYGTQKDAMHRLSRLAASGS